MCVATYSTVCEGVRPTRKLYIHALTQHWDKEGHHAGPALPVVLYQNRAVRNNRCQQVAVRNTRKRRRKDIQHTHFFFSWTLFFQMGISFFKCKKYRVKKCRGVEPCCWAEGVESPLLLYWVCVFHSLRQQLALCGNTYNIALPTTKKNTIRYYSDGAHWIIHSQVDDMRSNANLHQIPIAPSLNKTRNKPENEFFSSGGEGK